GVGGIGPAYVESGTPDDARGPALANYDDSSWRTVHLPHDYVVAGTFTPTADTSHGSLPVVPAWYRKHFTIPAADKGRRIWIDFDGIYRDSRLWLNGKFLGRHESGYTGFRFDVTDSVIYGGQNTLAVRVDPRAGEGWWYEGGGIYRHVWLNESDPLHTAPWGVHVTATPDSCGPARIDVQTHILNQESAGATYQVVTDIRNAENTKVASVKTMRSLGPDGQDSVSQSLDINGARLWSLEDPYLYHAVTSLVVSGKVVDSVTTPFGIRTVRFDAQQGFFLNGKPVKLKGTCNHQDFAGVGIGMPDSVFEWRIKKLKQMGCNGYRMSHNPPAPELLDACDRLGMLVMDENRHLGDTYSNHTPRGTGYANLGDLTDMILRDRNHPSVIMWSMCNEEGLQGTPEGARIFQAMMDRVHFLDNTRPITCAMNGSWGEGIGKIEDLQGCNYNPGGYAAFHRDHPNTRMYGSETASTVSTRGIYKNDGARGYVSAYDANFPPWAQTAENAWEPIARAPYMAGGFVWTGFDYKGEPTPYGWPCINSHFGIMDECGFPKDNYYYYLAWWGDKPVVHLLPHWNWPGKEGAPIDVWCYSNCHHIELLLNGKSLGEKAMPPYEHVQWSVPYEPGRLEARGFTNGKLMTTNVVVTTGPPARIALKVDRRTLKADGEDAAMVEVSIVDSRGRVVPTADNEVTFTSSGAAGVTGVGNGDPSSHEPDRASRRKAFNGLCMAIVQPGSASGSAQITANSPGLAPASIRFIVR
ncbi:MAG TPA: beta-galactosidase GalA, partial [Chthonomonadales bacterium]|nr:beta-galactosidase GalA [Chthonomonadales bacterium]